MVDLRKLTSGALANLEREVLGEGTYGRVSLVYWQDSPIVIKESKDSNYSDFSEEVNKLRLLDGAGGAPKVLAFFGSPLTIVTTFKGRYTLEHYISKGSLPDHVILRVALGVAERLQEVHAVGIIHNDIKCDNVMVEFPEDGSQDEPCVSIIDYGLSCASGTSIGLDCTDEYYHIAPEVRRGGLSTPESDIYSFGIMLWRLSSAMKDDVMGTVLSFVSEDAVMKDGTSRITLEGIISEVQEAIEETGSDSCLTDTE